MHNLEGLELDRFKIEKLLGTGGFSVVYRVFDPQRNDIFALKLLLKQWTRYKEVVRLFVSEGRTASLLDHPNIIDIYEVGQVYGQPYHLMEVCPGGTLADLVGTSSGSELDLGQLCHLLQQVARGLDYIHQKRLVHRDIKPSNILVCNDHSVKLADFGLTLSLMGMGLRDRDTAGTPKYMSPEQKRGKNISYKTDLYSLGLVIKYAFEMLQLSIPQRAEEAISSLLAADPRKRPSTATEVTTILCSCLMEE